MVLGASLLLATGVAAQDKKTFAIDDLIPGGATYSAHVPENIYGLQWWGDVCIKPEIDKVVSVDFANKMKETTLVTLEQVNTVLAQKSLGKVRHLYSVSFPFADKKVMKIDMPQKSLFYDIDAKQIVSVLNYGNKAGNQDFSNDYSSVAYTIDNNLYLTNVAGKDVQITNEPKGVVCGQSVHRNEFGIHKGIFWSPKSNYLAFYRMDESMVADYPFVDIDTRIATVKQGKYPMAGMASHEVTIGIYNLKSGKTIYLNTGNPKDRYFTNISWSPDEKSIYFIELNRDQNHSQLFC